MCFEDYLFTKKKILIPALQWRVYGVLVIECKVSPPLFFSKLYTVTTKSVLSFFETTINLELIVW